MNDINQTALTFYFKDIFPTNDDFLNYIKEYEINELTDETDITFANFIYKILFRQFHNSNVQYDTPDAFKTHLANRIEDVFQKYKRQQEIIQKTIQLTDDELTLLGEALANRANNPNTAPDDPRKPIEFISNQVYSYTTNGKLQAYLTALNNIPTLLIKEFTGNCQSLFKTIIPNTYYIF